METSRISLLANGRAIIKRYLEDMPNTPGVYRMLDAKGIVLYVGKANNLKHRVSSYALSKSLNNRLQRMIEQTASMEIASTRSEAEALLLEANLIKKLSPRYNVLLKDDKSFPYIFFSGDHDYPRISKHRGPKTKKGKYFGPFVSAGAVDETIALLQKAFLIRPCSDNVFKNRTRPCLQYQIKRCSAPCVGKINPDDYGDLVSQAQAFLVGKTRQIQDQLVAEMQALSLKMHYEKARIVRDRIRALTHVQQQHGITHAISGDADVIALARNDKGVCIQLASFRGGRNFGTRSWFPTQTTGHSDSDIFSNFISRYYQNYPPPPSLLVSHLLEESALLEEALRLGCDYKVEIVHPLRGEKRTLIELALTNAKEALKTHLSMRASQREVLEGVQRLFGLEEPPQRIEVYDNSHISGAHAVGAMIVAGQEGFKKGQYRKFNITQSELAPGDDYAMLREVLTRRFKKLQEDADTKTADLVIIDGGAGQLSVATAVFEELGIQDIKYIGMAKGPDRNVGREQFFVPGREPFQLPPDNPVLHFLQRLRDEAHRFAIGAHRNKRSSAMRSSELEAIPFIGAMRKKALLHHFGSAKAVAVASQEDIQKVSGISKSMAGIIYRHFHG